MKVKYFLYILFFPLLISAIPLHPDLKRRLKEEGRLARVTNIFKESRRRGVEAPNPKPFRVEGKRQTTLNAICILVDFSDIVADTLKYPIAHYDSLLSSLNTYPTGSMRDYYLENSYNNVDIITTVVGWLRMPQTYVYYVDGSYGIYGNYPNNCRRLAEDAVYKANTVGVDFSQFDNDGDNYIDALFIVHAGPGAEVTGDSNDIWSHAWSTYNVPYVDGVYAWSYSTEPDDGKIGVFSHELGHSLFGLPDLYDYDYDSWGAGKWTLMAFGSWNGPFGNAGAVPAHLDAWCKIQSGFITPNVLLENTWNATVPFVEKYDTAYKMWTYGIPVNEYFLVENRQKKGFDSYLPSSGLLIYHVDESIITGNDNQWYPGYTDSGHYLVAVEQADGLWDLEKNINQGDGGDPYPGTTLNRYFNKSSTPNSDDYLFNTTYVGVENISDSDTLMKAYLLVEPIVHDVGVYSVYSPPDSVYTDSTYYPKALVKNWGTIPDTFGVVCEISVSGYYDTLSIDLMNTQDSSVTFDPWTVPSSPGTYLMEIYTTLAQDEDTTNNKIFRTITSSTSGIEITDENILHQRFTSRILKYLNPGKVRIEYTIPKKGMVILRVYDVTGREVITLVEKIQDTGTRIVEWVPITSGVYIYSINFENQQISNKIILLK